MRTSLQTTGMGNETEVPPSQRQFEQDSLDLAKHLQCPICLDTFGLPVARLRPCMHYFCASCIRTALGHAKTNTDKCPQCKHVYSRRDIEEDGFLSGLIEKFMAFEEVLGSVREAMKDLERHRGDLPGDKEHDHNHSQGDSLARQKVANMMLPWVQGIDDEAYESPEESFSELFSKEREKEGALKDDAGTGAVMGDDGNDNGKDAATVGGDGPDEVVVPTQLHVVPPSESESESMSMGVGKGVVGRVGDILEGLEEAISQEDAGKDGNGKRDSKELEVPELRRIMEDETGKVTTTTTKERLVVSSAEEVLEEGSSQEGGKENQVENETPAEKKEKCKGNGKSNGKAGASKAKAGSRPTKSIKATKSTKVRSTQASRKKKEAEVMEGPTPSTLGTPLTDTRRRVPARLMPWTCGACTFENKGAAADCQICGTAKGKDAGQVAAEQASIAKEAKSGTKKGAKKGAAKGVRKEEVDTRAEVDVAPSTSKPSNPPCASRVLKKQRNARQNVEGDGGAELAVNAVGEVHLETTPPAKAKLSARERRLLNSSERKGKRAKTSAVPSETCEKTRDTKMPKVDRKAPLVCTTKSGMERDERDGVFLPGVVATSSNLSADDKGLLECSIPTYVSSWADSVTHVICPSSKEPVVTFKYLTALLKGAHIVSMDWLIQCIEQKLHVDEAPYSLKPDAWTGSMDQNTDGPTAADGRAGAKYDAAKLLSKYEVQVVLPPVSKKENPVGMAKIQGRVEGLLKAAGAKLVNRLPRPIQGGDKRCLVLVVDSSSRNASDPNEASQIVMESWYARAQGAHIPVVRQAWLKESILRGLSLENYDDFSI